MSSPLAILKKNFLKKAIINFHQNASHNKRTDLLSKLLSGYINKNFNSDNISCLDVGCGDMIIAENIGNINKNTHWTCIDIHKLPISLMQSEKWKKYRQFNGYKIPFENKTFDVVIFCDVLHHTPENTFELLKEAARVGKVVLIKDHFEYGWYSRQMLRLMDFVGNWSYGINVPKKYFNKTSFTKECKNAGFCVINIMPNINLYSHLPFINVFIHKKWQFIAELKS